MKYGPKYKITPNKMRLKIMRPGVFPKIMIYFFLLYPSIEFFTGIVVISVNDVFHILLCLGTRRLCQLLLDFFLFFFTRLVHLVLSFYINDISNKGKSQLIYEKWLKFTVRNVRFDFFEYFLG